MNKKIKRLIQRGGLYLAAIITGLFFGSPLLFMVSTALKPRQEWLEVPVNLIPNHPTLKNFDAVLGGQFPRFFLNSLGVATAVTLLTLALALLASYAFVRMNVPAGKEMFSGIILAQMLPGSVIIIPIFQLMRTFGLIDTYLALVLAELSFALPVAIWLLRSYLVAVPEAVEESAMLDGANRLTVLVRIVLPLIGPGIAATATFIFFASWQEFAFSLTLMTSTVHQTLPVGILGFIGEHVTDWGQLMAAAVLLMLPTFAIFGVLQQKLVSGLTAGSTKEN